MNENGLIYVLLNDVFTKMPIAQAQFLGFSQAIRTHESGRFEIVNLPQLCVETTRQKALAHGLKKYYTGIPCRNGHLTYRYTASAACAACTHKSKKKC